MVGHYIAIKTFEHQIACFCPGADHAEHITINKGDIIEVTAERKFTMAYGCFFLIDINERYVFYMAFEDLKQYFMKELLLSTLDITLKINYLQYKINQALDLGDEASFMNFTKELKENREFNVKLEKYLTNMAV